MCSLCALKSRRPYANIRTRTQNVIPMKRIVIAITPMTVPEGTGQIARGSLILVTNVNQIAPVRVKLSTH